MDNLDKVREYNSSFSIKVRGVATFLTLRGKGGSVSLKKKGEKRNNKFDRDI